MRWLFLLLFVVQPALAQSYLSAEEAAVLNEINLLRTQPQKYVTFLETVRGQYKGMLWNRPGGAVMTREGVAAVDEAIQALREQAPLGPLEPSLGLTLAARDHVQDQSASGRTGHDGSDGSQPTDRMNRYGGGSRTGENISYGLSAARDIIVQLLVDDGWPSRGHRLNLLQPAYEQAGLCLGGHRRYGAMCVMDLGAGYSDRPGLVAPPRSGGTRPSTAGTGASSPARPAGPFEQARGVALAHYQALMADDRAAWMETWSRSQRGTLGQRWHAARTAAAGQEYRYAGTQKVSPSRMTLVFVRQAVRCPITVILEGGGWKVEEANY